jgi:hypothetical protein
LGWLNQRLSVRTTAEPELLSLLFELEPHAMHLLGVAIAHGCNESLLAPLFRQAPKTIVEQSIGFWPGGLDRLVHVLPPTALSLEEYRAIPQLLSDKSTAKYLNHSPIIDGSIIAGLASLSDQLRRPSIFKLFGQIEGMDRFVNGLGFLSERAGVGLDDLIAELSRIDQPEQVVAKIAALVDSLPLQESLPPPLIGSFRRVDSVAKIRLIAKDWRNCVADCLHDINATRSAIYLSAYDDPPAVALLCRIDRLGWALQQIRGPNNEVPNPQQSARYEQTFAQANIPPWLDIAAIKGALMKVRWVLD